MAFPTFTLPGNCNSQQGEILRETESRFVLFRRDNPATNRIPIPMRLRKKEASIPATAQVGLMAGLCVAARNYSHFPPCAGGETVLK